MDSNKLKGVKINTSSTIFPHLPKTAGRTLVANIRKLCHEGEDFFHLGPNGRQEGPISLQYEEIDKGTGHQCFVLFGHEVDEGVINYFDKSMDICLVTAIRHPLKRLESHFNMKYSAGVFNESFRDYMCQQSNPMCRWYIRTFPSFVNDPFDSLYDQALQVLSKFSDVLIQEKARVDFPRFMESLGGEFEKELSTNRSGIEYAVASAGESIESLDLEIYLRQDLQLYSFLEESMSPSNAKKVCEFPVINTFHRWWLPFLNNFGSLKSPEVGKRMHESVKNNPVLWAATHSLSSSSVVGQRAAAAISINADWVMENNERLSNAIEVIQVFGVQARPIGQGVLALLLNETFNASKETRLLNNVSSLWMRLPSVSADVALMQGRWLKKNGQYDKAIEAFSKSCQLAPHKPIAFKEMGSLAMEMEDYKLATKCALKVGELNPKAGWASGTCQPDSDRSLKINVDFAAVLLAAESVGKFTTL